MKESPPEVQRLLLSLGLRPINDIVDISNLVMMTCGQPLHIFDLERLQGDQIRVRRARPGETLRLLDERDVPLNENILLIADASRPLALAGIMGGLASGISARTRHIFIESACFNPVVIRRGARQLGLKTDASYRFERGMDVEATVPAMKMALHLLARSQGRKMSPAFFQDVYPRPLTPPALRLDKDYPGRLAGVAIPENVSSGILERLGFTLRDQGDFWQVQPPSFRVDVTCKQDLVEEIIRIHGYGHLRGVLPLTANPVLRIDRERGALLRLKTQLADVGFNEVINYVFQSPEENALVDPQSQPLALKNPLGKDFSVLKNSLLAGLLKNTAANVNQSLERVALFEIGKVFGRRDGKIREESRLAVSAYGRQQKKDWRLAEQDFAFPLFKSLLVLAGRRLRLELAFKKAAHPAFDDACCFAVNIDGRPCGWCGAIAAGFSRLYKLEKTVYAAEIDLAALLGARGREPLPPLEALSRRPPRFHLPDGPGRQLRGVERPHRRFAAGCPREFRIDRRLPRELHPGRQGQLFHGLHLPRPGPHADRGRGERRPPAVRGQAGGRVGSNSTIRSAAMSFKEFDKLEEKINRLISGMKALRDENQKLKKELQEIKHDSSQRDSEKSEVRKKIASLIDLVDSLGE